MNLEIALHRLAKLTNPNSDGETLFSRRGTLKSVIRHFKRGRLESTSLNFDRDMEPDWKGICLFSTPLGVPLELIGRKIIAEEFYHSSIGPFYYKGYVVKEFCSSQRIAVVQHQWEFGKYFDNYSNSYDLYRKYEEERDMIEQDGKK